MKDQEPFAFATSFGLVSISTQVSGSGISSLEVQNFQRTTSET